MSGEKQFQKTFTRRKKACDPSNNVNNVQKRDEENEKEKGKEVEVEGGDQTLREKNPNADEVSVVPSSSAESQRESGDIDGEIARKPIENGGCGSSSVSMTATRKGKCDGDGGNGSMGRKQQPEKKRHKEEKQSQQGKQKKQRKEEVLKAKAKPKPKQKQEEKKKKKGKDGGERDVVKKKKETDVEEDEASAGCRFPVSRVDRIIKSEGSDYRITHEAVFLINKATEKFLEMFCEDSYECAAHDCKNYVSYNHLSTVVSKEDRFDFLSDYVPERVKAEKAENLWRNDPTRHGL